MVDLLKKDYIFLFDLDSTITKKEILPEIAKYIGKEKDMRELTEATMRGELPFKTSFLRRIKLLDEIPVDVVSNLVSEIPINEHMVEFIRKNPDRCFVVTGNLQCWISRLIQKFCLQEHCYCSKADVAENKITQVVSVVDKELMVKQFIHPLVVIGDGDNDSGMARVADIAIGFGGVRNIAPSLLETIDYAFYEDKKCAEFLWSML